MYNTYLSTWFHEVSCGHQNTEIILNVNVNIYLIWLLLNVQKKSHVNKRNPTQSLWYNVLIIGKIKTMNSYRFKTHGVHGIFFALAGDGGGAGLVSINQVMSIYFHYQFIIFIQKMYWSPCLYKHKLLWKTYYEI